MLGNIKKTAKHSFIYSIANATNKLVGFILIPLYTSSFSVAVYGLLALFDTVADFLLTFSSFGIMEALNRWYWDKKTKGKQRKMFFTVLVFTIISSLVFIVLVYFIFSHFKQQIFGLPVSGRTLLLFLGSVFSNILLQRILILFRIQQKAIENMAFNVLRMVLVLGLTIYFIIGLQWGIDSVFVSRLIGQLITLIILIPQIIKNCEFRFNMPILKEMLSYSWPLALSASLGLIFTFSDRWMLQGMRSLDDVGNYSLAYRISNIIRVVLVHSFVQAFIPIYFRKMDNKQDFRFFSKSATYFSLLLTMTGMIIVLFSKEIIHLLARNAEYYASVDILPYLILSVIFSGLLQIIVLPFNKYKKTKLMSLISISSGLVNIGLNILLIPRMGGIGAAIATAITQLMMLVTYFILNKRIVDFDFETGKIVLLFTFGAFFVFIGMQTTDLPLWFSIPAKLLLVAVFPVILKLFGFYEDIELLRIRQSWKKWRNPLRWKEHLKNMNLRG
ncbi:MAG: flippase [bacterium]|jgi:O-antigen/teichoic acid export membrane protein|nr:flippase [bacterium]